MTFMCGDKEIFALRKPHELNAEAFYVETHFIDILYEREMNRRFTIQNANTGLKYLSLYKAILNYLDIEGAKLYRYLDMYMISKQRAEQK